MPAVCPHCSASLNQSPPPPACPMCGGSLAGIGRPAAVVAFGNAGGAAPSPRADPHVFVNGPDGQSGEFPLGPSTRIGRHPINTLRLADREISKEHAEIKRVGTDYWVHDLGSSNGTFLNGKRVDRMKLNDGDEILVGGTTLTFHAGAVAKPAPVAAPPAPKPAKPAGVGSVTMVQSLSPHVLASMRAEEKGSDAGFRPEREITDTNDLRRDYEKLRIANEFHRQVGLETNTTALFEKILKFAFDILNAETGVILTPTGPNGSLKPASVRQRRGGEVMLSTTLLDKVVQSHEGVLTQDAIIDSRFSASASIVSQGIRSAMAVPLLSKGELHGVLYLDTRERVGAFGEKDLRILTGVAGQAAVSMENASLAVQVEKEAATRAVMSRFLPPALVEQAVRGDFDIAKGGKQSEITILFADIRGFTSMTEKAPAQDTVRMLNDYFEAMVEVIFAHGGALDKFIGDCIMAHWGAFVQRKDDPGEAVRTAVDMQAKLKDVNAEWKKAGRPTVNIGIGINTGEAVVGYMGSSVHRLELTAIGDAVNLASRLCSVAKTGEVIVSAETLRRAGGGLNYDELPATKVKGKEQPIPIFRVNGYEETTRIR